MLSVTAEDALRALTQMARRPAGSSILGNEPAEKTRVPANYLSQILLSLRNAGFLATARGSGGGDWLVCAPQRIYLNEIIRLFDGRAKFSCLLGVNEQCDDRNPCSAHAAWRNLRLYYEQFLATTTLADIATGRAPRLKVRRARAGDRP